MREGGENPFANWRDALQAVDPDLSACVQRHLRIAEESGPLPKSFRHLILAAVDSVVTHLYPRGIAVHAKLAIEAGASFQHVMEALQIAAMASSRGYPRALPIVLEELERAGVASGVAPDAELATILKARWESEFGACPPWLESAAHENPIALEALLNIGARRDAETGLDGKSRALLAVWVCASPAMIETGAMRLHVREALRLGATAEELLQTLRIADCIGMHPIVEGVMAIHSLANLSTSAD